MTAPRPRRWEMLLDVAEVIARRSTCNRLHVGVVVAREGRIQTTGYNGPPSGMDHCDHPRGDYQGPHTQPCLYAVHAEANALVFAARYGMATDGAELYCTHAPCLNCAKLIVNAGIRIVWFRQEFRDMSGVELLERAGLEVTHDARTAVQPSH